MKQPLNGFKAAGKCGAKLAAQIQAAQKRMRQVRVTDSARAAAAEMTEEAGCAGNRAELYLIETARALAAWENATVICASHLAHAAYFVLPGRGKLRLSGQWRNAFSKGTQEEPGARVSPPEPSRQESGEGSVTAAGGQAASPSGEPAASPAGRPAASPAGRPASTSASPSDGEITAESGKSTSQDSDENQEWLQMEQPPDENAWLLQEERQKRHAPGKNGRRRELQISSDTGHCIRAVPGSCRESSEIALSATLLHAAAHSGGKLPLQIRETDIRKKVREGRGGYYILFAVDASASMGGAKRLELTGRMRRWRNPWHLPPGLQKEPLTVQFAAGKPLQPGADRGGNGVCGKAKAGDQASAADERDQHGQAGDYIREHKIATGVSLDGIPEVNERLRGRTAEAVAGIRTLGEAGVYVNLMPSSRL